MQSLDIDIQGFSYRERQGVLPALTRAFAACGGWVVERRSVSDASTEFRIEIRLADIFEFYSTLLSAGVELTRAAHLALTGLCTCHHHLAFTGELAEILMLRLEISFLENVTLHSLLATRGDHA